MIEDPVWSFEELQNLWKFQSISTHAIPHNILFYWSCSEETSTKLSNTEYNTNIIRYSKCSTPSTKPY